jgi:hypothetical protein
MYVSEQPGGYGWMGGFANVDNVFGLIYCLQGGCIGLVTEMVSSIVMYNFGVGPRGGPFVYSILEGQQSNLLLWGSG